MSGPGREFRIRLVTAGADELDVGRHTEAETSLDGDHQLTATVVPPRGPFRVVVTGVDLGGRPFQRVHAPLFNAFPQEPTGPPGR
jgi:hypothetical protein